MPRVVRVIQWKPPRNVCNAIFAWKFAVLTHFPNPYEPYGSKLFVWVAFGGDKFAIWRRDTNCATDAHATRRRNPQY
eukprot:6770038-Pyramimonas_sp.AAC.1